MGKSAERAERLGIRVVANRERRCGNMSHEIFFFFFFGGGGGGGGGGFQKGIL